jgi:hypothetical protein
MALIAKAASGTDFEPLAAGMHASVCYGIVDLGTQPSNNPQFKPTRKVALLWEVPDERIEFVKDGVKKNLPRGISAMFTLSLGTKSKMRPMLESWRGRPFTEAELEGFDVKNVLGANCLLNVVHKAGTGANAGKVYANVASVNPLAKGMVKRKPENPLVWFSIEECEEVIHIPENVPEWLVLKINQSDEWIASKNPKGIEPTDGDLSNTSGNDLSEDVPF